MEKVVKKITSNLVIILLAGGIGSRLKQKTSKQMISYNDETILEKNIISFKKYLKNIPIQVISNRKDLSKVIEINKKFNILPPVLGGNERQKSVFNALVSLKKVNPKYVLIHDAARPLVSWEVINKLLKYCEKEIVCVVPTLNVADAIRTVSKNLITDVVSKKGKVLVQTPQLCNYKLLMEEHVKSKILFEDESSLFLNKGMRVIATEGDPLTLKITYEKDLKLLEPHLYDNNTKYVTKVGNGFDIHRFDLTKNKDKNFIKLGGIKINNIRPLIGHSDGDVLLHAITDSILGIINKGDIGELFPPSDNKWKDADSSYFLKHASIMLKKEKGKINNIDTVIICEKPKILNYSKQIAENIAKILNINPQRISIKGKTSESVGFIGRQEGIAAMATTSVQITEKIFDD
jgi:2-C-methyl-D-erythritol 4-phosphate cytidylyltransferase/2-C-methyl-D-erythritol 2,4-cyclodiphosphate synthase